MMPDPRIDQQKDGSGDLAQKKLTWPPPTARQVQLHEVRCSRCTKVVRVCDRLNHDMASRVSFCDCPMPATNQIVECPPHCAKGRV